ncbi:hypothetical protein [Breoghania sp.]|uniref:hypothetical protein n=1 Tax=Breoghania sp. TaxID=2065378 RepID=UPI002AA66211|nr:hypothetical protein [Breoghania sp.]
MTSPPFHFLLGGHDLEMVEIALLLREHEVPFSDHGLSWGASLSHYRSEIAALAPTATIPVGVELTDDLPPDAAGRNRVRLIDHHGPSAGAEMPTALEQVFALIDAPQTTWTRWRALVAANDRGHVRELKACGASDDEIRHIRQADRRAQGIDAREEAEARQVLRHARTRGRLTIINAIDDKASAIADFILPELGGPGYDRLLVVMPHEVAFFGDGAAIELLIAAFPQGWYGGALPDHGFFGMRLDEKAKNLPDFQKHDDIATCAAKRIEDLLC